MQLKPKEIDATVTSATLSTLHLGAGGARALINPMVDSLGTEALRVTIVVSGATAEKISGETAVDLIAKISEDLLAKGEERFPLVEFATEEELAAGDDPES